MNFPPSPRFGRVLAAPALLLLGMTMAMPVQAQSSGPTFQAELTAPPRDNVYIINDTAFRCNGTACQAGKSTSSARSLCARFVRKAGPVSAFSHNGEAFDAEALAKCND